MNLFHTPVMPREAIEALQVEKGKKYIDATVGGGGHAVEIEKRGGILLGIDADQDAVEFARKNLKSQVVLGNFRDIESIAKENGFEKVSGILFDLGVSSHELDTPERGFSYRFTNAPLDLRFDQTKGETAAQLVNRAREDELYEILARFGEEQLARPIARAIFRARAVKDIGKVRDLVAVVRSVIDHPKGVTATLSRVFQALRIAVNEELVALKEGLVGAKNVLEGGGRLVVISFHSLEDRAVKQFFRQGDWKIVTKKPLKPGRAEVVHNPRARSAKLRIAEKL